METSGHGLKVAKPTSILTKPLKADGKGLFKALTKGAVHVGTGKWAELLPDVSEMITALGIKTEPEKLAWLLIRRALTHALCEFVDENANWAAGTRWGGAAACGAPGDADALDSGVVGAMHVVESVAEEILLVSLPTHVIMS